MSENQVHEDIYKLIANLETKEALQILENNYASSHRKEITLLRSRYANYIKKNIGGTVKNEQLNRQLLEINNAILSFLEHKDILQEFAGSRNSRIGKFIQSQIYTFKSIIEGLQGTNKYLLSITVVPPIITLVVYLYFRDDFIGASIILLISVVTLFCIANFSLFQMIKFQIKNVEHNKQAMKMEIVSYNQSEAS